MPYGNISRALNNEGNMSGTLTIQPTAGGGVSDVLMNGESVVTDHKAYVNIEVEQTVTEGKKIAGVIVNENNTDILIPEIKIYNEATGDLITIEDAMEAPLEECKVTLEPQQAGTGDPSPSNVRPISGWDEVKVNVSPTQDAEDGTTYTIQLGSTCYGGELDVVNGVLRVDRVMVDMGDFNWTKSSDNIFYSRQDSVKYQGILLSSSYKGYVGALVNMPDYSISATNSQTYLLLRIKDSSKWATMNASEFKTAMSGVQLVYELATPQEIPLTPTEVTLLRGINNLWSDGEMYVKWRVDVEMLLQSIIDNR